MKFITKLKIYMLVAMIMTFGTSFQNITIAYAAEDNTIDYFVRMPKVITLDANKQGEYSIVVSGSIPDYKMVYVSPVDGIKDTDSLDFYMIDQAAENRKDNVPATIIQSKFYWNHEEVSNAYEESNNDITANGLSAGNWKGIINIEISLVNDPDHVHSYTSTVTKQPTCTEEGERTYTCECGDTYTEKIPATGHKYGEDDRCEHCGELDSNHEHDYTVTITKEPTCTEEGERTYTCKCGDTYTEKIPATGHKYGDDDRCEHCGELDPNHEHSYTSKVTKEPTCTEDGERTYTCKCGDTYTEKIPATGHKYGDDDRCEHCGELDPNHEHNYTVTITKEPTCTEEGEKTYTCKCGDTYTEKISATGHKYGDDDRCEHCRELNPDHEHNYTVTITKEPTCTEDGERTYTCKCGDTYTEKIPATGHSYGDDDKCEHCGELNPNHEHNYTVTITKEPTCTEEGEKIYTCVCGDTYTEKIPVTGHHYVDGECEHCGEKDPDYHKHNYTITITKEPTCTEEGERTYTCECGDTYTEIIPITHTYKPLWFNHDTPKSQSRSLIAESSTTVSNSGSLSISIPDWYPTAITYSYTGDAQVYGYVSGTAKCGSVTSSASNTSTNTSSSNSKRTLNGTMILRPGVTNTINMSISIKSKSGSSTSNNN